MLHLSREGIKDRDGYEKAGIKLPSFDVTKAEMATRKTPVWVHFGAGNIFRGFLAAAQQKLMNQGACTQGIIAAEPFDFAVIDQVYKPFDNLSLLALLKADGTVESEVIASVLESVKADSSNEQAWGRLKEIFKAPGLQMVTFTITEKGYALSDMEGNLFPVVERDLKEGPDRPKHTMAILTSLLLERYQAGREKIAVVSMDNCARNGERLSASVKEIARQWRIRGYVEEEFLTYLDDEQEVSFPWTMIDKITPHPSEKVRAALMKAGLSHMDIVKTDAKTVTAPFVNAEEKEYLVVEDKFPAGRPPLEQAGVLFTDRETVDRVEQMKVGTCLNPLHTALAIFGCLLGYESIAEEMKDQQLRSLIEKMLDQESMKVVVDPGIIRPDAFAEEVMKFRFPNPFIPDTPQRIASDTSQKLPVRFGKTVKAYVKRDDLDPASLEYIPLVFAGWFRYLLGVDDEGRRMAPSPDPMLESLTEQLKDLELGRTEKAAEVLKPILQNEHLFGADLVEIGLADKVITAFQEMSREKGSVRAVLKARVD